MDKAQGLRRLWWFVCVCVIVVRSEEPEDCEQLDVVGFTDYQRESNGHYRKSDITVNGHPTWTMQDHSLYYYQETGCWKIGTELNTESCNGFEKGKSEELPLGDNTWQVWDRDGWIDLHVTVTCINAANAGDMDGKVVLLEDAHWDRQVLAGGRPHLVQFMAPWCGHCQKLHPIWTELAATLMGRTYIGRLDCTRNDMVRSRYHVRSYPTIKLFNHGRITEFKGHRSLAGFQEFLDEHQAYLDAAEVEQEPIVLHTYEHRLGSEVIRLILHETGLPYTETRYIADTWEMVEDEQAAGQGMGRLPLLTSGGVAITYTGAITRYLARAHKLYGKTTAFQSMVDAIITHCELFYERVEALVMSDKEETYQAELPTFQLEISRWVQYLDDLLMRNLNAWQEYGRDVYCCGPAFTIGDLYLWDVISIILGFAPRSLDRHDIVQNYFMSIGTRDNLGDYLGQEGDGEGDNKHRPACLTPDSAHYGNRKNMEPSAANPFKHQ